MDHDVLCGIAFNLKPCSCGDCSRPEVYKQGFASQRIAAPTVESEIYFTLLAGYIVRCNSCGAHTTEYFSEPEEAVKAWNDGKVIRETFREALNRANDILKGAVGCQENSLSADTPA